MVRYPNYILYSLYSGIYILVYVHAHHFDLVCYLPGRDTWMEPSLSARANMTWHTHIKKPSPPHGILCAENSTPHGTPSVCTVRRSTHTIPRSPPPSPPSLPLSQAGCTSIFLRWRFSDDNVIFLFFCLILKKTKLDKIKVHNTWVAAGVALRTIRIPVDESIIPAYGRLIHDFWSRATHIQ